MDQPAVSVVIPTRGRPGPLRRAVESVVGQEFSGVIECLVVFDGEPAAELELPVDPRRLLRLLVNERTPGPSGARNAGVSVATGDLVAFLDDDDEWAPDKLARQVALLDKRRDAVAATCGARWVSGDKTFVRVPPTDTLTKADLIASRRTELHTSTLLVARTELDRVGPFDEMLPAGYGEDYDWFLRATALGPIAVERRPLVTLHLGASWFASDWDTIVKGVLEQLRRHPELARDRRNLGRMYGRVAFAHAAAGRSREALRWSGRSLRRDPFQWRGYAAIAVALRLVTARRVAETLATRGRGI